MKRILIRVVALAVAAPVFALASGGMQGVSGMQLQSASMSTGDGAGVVKAVDPRAGTVTIQHGPIAGMKWPPMTTTFKARSAALLKGVAVGQSVRFQATQMGAAVQLTAIGSK